jgi:hypothetical protein
MTEGTTNEHYKGTYWLYFILPQRKLVFMKKREGLHEIDKDEAEERKVGCLRGNGF